MTRLDLGPIGIALNVASDDSHLDEAAEVERLGYSTIWLPGGQIDSLHRLTQIVQATTTIRVAPAIISLDAYESDAVRRLYAGLQDTAPDRFIVGLGGPQRPQPLPALTRYLDELDAGHPPVPRSRRILAALGPRKLAIARDRCAGAITLLVTPAFTASARTTLGAGPTLVVDQFIVLDTNAARARETAREPLRFLSRISGYATHFARMGFAESDISDLSDRLVDELIGWGNADAVTARIRDHLAAGADQVALSVLSRGDQPRPIEVARQLAGTLVGSNPPGARRRWFAPPGSGVEPVTPDQKIVKGAEVSTSYGVVLFLSIWTM